MVYKEILLYQKFTALKLHMLTQKFVLITKLYL